MRNDPGSSPLAFFASELKRLRGTAGMTQEQLAAEVNYSPALIASIENSSRFPSKDLAERADKVLNSDGLLARLQDLVEQMSVLPWFRDRIEVERRSVEIREYEPYLIPGLLQIEHYARAVVSATRPVLSDDAVERAVALRMTRQEILNEDDDSPIDRETVPRLWVIIDESALGRTVGSPEIMQEQRDHLVAMSKRPNITIQIIPSDEGPTSAFGRAFAILISQNNSSVIYFEDIGTARYVRDRDEVSRYMLIFDHLRASALNDKRSLKLINGEDK